MKIKIPIEEKVVTDFVELECPYFIHRESDMDEEGYVTESFYKIVSPCKVIEITKNSRFGKDCDYQLDYKYDIKNPAYLIPKYCLKDGYYKCDESDFEYALTEATEFFSE